MPRPEPRRRPAPVIVRTVDPQVWQAALVLAHGVPTRIERVSHTECIVHNQPRSG